MSSNDKIHGWAVNLINDSYLKSIKDGTSRKLPSPPGFKGAISKKDAAPSINNKDLKDFQIQRSWEIATQPARSIPMNMFMSYMSGTSLQIIPIMTALMLLSGPIKAIFSVKSNFKPLLGHKNGITENEIYCHMLVYILFQVALMLIGLHKLYSMGLFPTTKSDWVSWEKPIQMLDSLQIFMF
ncbi:hypothetical protein TPHA_0E02470 [Tetrapisispora phaffii CBS 4417]|uniref:ER membrane protein complex subunit 4 n=1 Tax=Tetrapisispora phaffii (strain ATCC 24235 / CBS 4417 / NBRC 1672 / NRRL Y-8282 / UCD 70-5) TaxID=1071381 RepID=G8BTW1_TETPH|nr:hypothetical protein TPHA_0E02470 [Tetrapisispora phaffii CBS 4417]CCE63339.1 hypothetical protein TPHA_0E02470 [Tetrapisispora phaffii CBS 4417]